MQRILLGLTAAFVLVLLCLVTALYFVPFHGSLLDGYGYGSATSCDLAAASPQDRARPAGIAGTDAIDPAAAAPACEAALAAAPQDPHLMFQTARVAEARGDPGKARAFYEQAAGLGYAAAQARLGEFYESGLGGLSGNDEEAARLYKLAADQGDTTAEARLGHFYETGRGGLPRNDEEAARLYLFAAVAGNPDAQASLGNFYGEGRGGLVRSDAEAARLFRLSADQGNPVAQSR
ncbi:MAG: sel1 repeat family protein, partial [Bradyrhizobiaceae bacterium]|nr:sel1 repeat family protein [Bradyrhizobiaceae bacterium]